MRTALALLLALVLAPAAQAQERTASGTDPAGDTGAGASDIVGLQAKYSPSGAVEVVVTLAQALPEGGSVEFEVHPRHRDQCSRDAQDIGELVITADHFQNTASSSFRPDNGQYPQGLSSLSDDRRTITVTVSDPALADLPFACVLALGEGYQDEWAGYVPGDEAFAQFPGWEKPQCADTLDNDGDGEVDEADQACESPDDPTEALGATPALTRREARRVAQLNAFVKLGVSGAKFRCRRRSALVFRCRARGRLRGTTRVKRVRKGDRYEDRVSRWRVRER